MQVAWKELAPEIKSEYQRAEGYLKQLLKDYVHLLYVANPDSEALPALQRTPAGQYQATSEHNRQMFVGIICDTRVMGESSHRPSIRLAPFDYVTALRS